MAFIIINKHKQPMHSFGSFDSSNDAYLVLRKAIEKLPDMGLKIVPEESIDETKEESGEKDQTAKD